MQFSGKQKGVNYTSLEKSAVWTEQDYRESEHSSNPNQQQKAQSHPDLQSTDVK